MTLFRSRGNISAGNSLSPLSSASMSCSPYNSPSSLELSEYSRVLDSQGSDRMDALRILLLFLGLELGVLGLWPCLLDFFGGGSLSGLLESEEERQESCDGVCFLVPLPSCLVCSWPLEMAPVKDFLTKSLQLGLRFAGQTPSPGTGDIILLA